MRNATTTKIPNQRPKYAPCVPIVFLFKILDKKLAIIADIITTAMMFILDSSFTQIHTLADITVLIFTFENIVYRNI